MKYRLWMFCLLSIVTLFLSACNVQIETLIDETGAGTAIGIFYLGSAELEEMREQNKTLSEFCQIQMTDGSRMPMRIHENPVACSLNYPFSNLTDISDMYEELLTGVIVNQLKFVDGELIYDIEVNGSELVTGSPNILYSSDSLVVEWRVTVPGKVGTNNADQVIGNTLVWNLGPGANRIYVESSDGSSALNGLLTLSGIMFTCLCCTAFLGGIGGASYLLARRTKQN